MFPILILGVALAIAAVLIAPLVTRHSAARVASVASTVIGMLAAAVGLFALFTGRGTLTIAALIVLAVSVIVSLTGNRGALAGPGGAGQGRSHWRRSGGGRGGAGRQSNIETEWLSMGLDHGTGDVDGEVRQGRFTGRRLGDMTVEEVLVLLRECQSEDAQSAQLLEAYLDRVAPGWRGGGSDAGGGGPGSAPGGQGPMTREEALDVLGLAEGASPAEIRAAHRKMMRDHHPDRGGSTWLAARINQAKELLLRES